MSPPETEDLKLLDWARAGELSGRARFEIPAGSALFAGHFPGRPVLPGIAHLAMLARALAALRSPDAPPGAIRAVRNLKLRRPLAPGDLVELTCEPLPGDGLLGIIGFTLRRAGEVVSTGAVHVDPCPTAGASEQQKGAALSGDAQQIAAPVPPGAHPWPAPATLIPHAPPALLITAILTASPAEIVCSAAVPEEHPLARERRKSDRGAWVETHTAPAYVGLEAAAQCAALLEALARAGSAPGPRIGYLVGVRRAHFGAELPAGRPLRVSARPAGSAPPLALYEIRVDLAGETRARATISTYLT
ncbi:MAG TPA: hypothetical protein VHR45_24495 [Thermoanaerobaculia bacterium]|nr:hypothetical protein [Thermoanaerobaculia bacterium]